MEGKVFYYFGYFWEVLSYIPAKAMWVCRRQNDGLADYFEEAVLLPLLKKNKFWEN